MSEPPSGGLSGSSARSVFFGSARVVSEPQRGGPSDSWVLSLSWCVFLGLAPFVVNAVKAVCVARELLTVLSQGSSSNAGDFLRRVFFGQEHR